MQDNGSPKFKIRFDDEGPFEPKASEPPLQAKAEDLRLKKLNRRINLFAVLIPCLLALMLLFVYFDIRNKFDNSHISGLSDVQKLSKDLDSKFSSLSIRQAKIEALLNEKISAMEKTAALLKQNLDQTEKALADVRSTAPGKQELAEIMAETDKRLAPMTADIKSLSSEIKKISSEAKSLQDKFDKESGKLAAGLGALQKEIGTLKTETSALASTRVDKKTFDLAIRHEERFFQQKLMDLEKSLSQKIESLLNQVKALEEKQKKNDAAAAPATRPPALSAPPPVESITPAIPERGKIIEQEIKR